MITFKNFRGDLFGGLTAAVVALPLALAFGVQSGLGPDAGLYGAIFLSFFAAFFGGTQTQISGPTAPMTAVSMLVIAGIIADFKGDVSAALPVILAVFLIAGGVQIVMGVLRVGQYIKFVPYPVVSGFMSGIGVIILITQLLPAMGYQAAGDKVLVERFKPEAEKVILERILQDEVGEDILVLEDFAETIKRSGEITEEQILSEAQVLAKQSAAGVMGSLRRLPNAFRNFNGTEFIITLLTIFIIYGFKRITTAVPSTLVSLVIMTAGSVLLGITYIGIGDIPSGLPAFQLSVFSQFNLGALSPYLVSAVILASLGAIDSLLTSVVADNMTRTKHNSNRELIGQGIGNSIAALFGGIPGAGATIRTVVNIEAGGRTRLSGMIAGVVLLLILLVVAPLAEAVPKAVLAGILITVGIGVMDTKGLKAILKTPRKDVLIMLTVLAVTVFVDLILAVGIGLVMATVFFMYEMSIISAKRTNLQPIAKNGNGEDIIVKQFHGPIFFGASKELRELTRKVPASAKGVVLDMHEVPYIDQTGLYTIEDIVLDLRAKDIQVVVAGIQEQPMARLRNIAIIPGLITEQCHFETLEEAKTFVAAKQNVEL